jgi:hypothetical protein
MNSIQLSRKVCQKWFAPLMLLALPALVSAQSKKQISPPTLSMFSTHSQQNSKQAKEKLKPELRPPTQLQHKSDDKKEQGGLGKCNGSTKIKADSDKCGSGAKPSDRDSTRIKTPEPPKPNISRTRTTTDANGNTHEYKDGKVTGVRLKDGTKATCGFDGKINSINTSNGTTITLLSNGSHAIETKLPDGGRLVTTGSNQGFVDHPFTRGNQTFVGRTYFERGHVSTRVYARFGRPGAYYYRYVSPSYYGVRFYEWAYGGWPTPVAWEWGWGLTPWYGYYGYYFAPERVYSAPSSWLTDYVIAENLQAAYESSDARESEEVRSGPVTVAVPGNQAWTHTGMFVNAGDDIRINATGGVAFSAGSEPLPPSGDPQSCLIAASGPYGWRASPFPDAHLRCWSLIGRIGDGTAFYVGNEKIIHAPGSGELLLGVNDNVLGDNSGSWVATVDLLTVRATGDRQTPSGSGGNQSAVVLTPEIKAAIVDEVNAQLAAEQTASTTTSSSSVPAEGQVSSGNQVLAALDPKQRTFIVSTALAEQTADGAQCLLNPGDILTRINETPDMNQKVTALVISSQKNDCASGSMLAISLQELQDMHNDFQARIDEGLGKLAENQGKRSMPKAPAVNSRPNPAGQAKSDPNVADDLQKQQQQADQTEKEVQVAANDGISN